MPFFLSSSLNSARSQLGVRTGRCDVGIQVEMRIPATSRLFHLKPKHRPLQPAVSAPPGSCHLPLPALFPRTTLYKYLHPRAGRHLSPAASLSLGELVLSLNSCSRSGCLWSDEGRPWVGGLQAPGVEGAVGGRNSDLKQSQGCGKDPSSLFHRLPTWPPSKSHLIPALAEEVGPASQTTAPPGGVCPTLGWRTIPKQTG